VTDRLLSAAEVGEFLGVPESWVRAQTRRPVGQAIPHLRLGRYVRFDREAVAAWLEGQRAGQWRPHKRASVNPDGSAI
jgi:excisionase family DNA binding protein